MPESAQSQRFMSLVFQPEAWALDLTIGIPGVASLGLCCSHERWSYETRGDSSIEQAAIPMANRRDDATTLVPRLFYAEVRHRSLVKSPVTVDWTFCPKVFTRRGAVQISLSWMTDS